MQWIVVVCQYFVVVIGGMVLVIQCCGVGDVVVVVQWWFGLFGCVVNGVGVQQQDYVVLCLWCGGFYGVIGLQLVEYLVGKWFIVYGDYVGQGQYQYCGVVVVLVQLGQVICQ